MKKTLIRGVALILVALSILLLAGSCTKWYNTNYKIKAWGHFKDEWERTDVYKIFKYKVSPLNKEKIPDVCIEVWNESTNTKGEKYEVKNIKQSGEYNGYPKYFGSCKFYDGGQDCRFDFTFYKTKDPDSGETVNALKMEFYHRDCYWYTLYAYEM